MPVEHRNNTYYLVASVGLLKRAYVMDGDGTMERKQLLYVMHCAHGMVARHWQVTDPDGTVIGIEIEMEVRDD